MGNKSDECYFCGKLSQFNFRMETAVCSDHWEMMYDVKVPNYINESQSLNYKKLALEKHIWKV